MKSALALVTLTVAGTTLVQAQAPVAPARRDTVRALPTIEVQARRRRPELGADTTRIRPIQRLTLPATASVTAGRAEETINLVDAEDIAKYLPSLYLRKRNYGDTQATLQTRTWGVSSSARTLVFVDGVPINALIGNNNTIGAQRWGLVTPDQVERADVMYGPFSAAYAGNSMGAVMEITTRMPEHLEASIGETFAVQHFDLYGTKRDLPTSQTAASIGDRFGKFSFWMNGNYQGSRSQPLTYVTSGTFPAGTRGGYADFNKLGAVANVLGASGLLHTDMVNATAKLAYDITPTVRAAYTFGFWSNSANAYVDSYLTSTSTGKPTFAGQGGFASGYYHLLQQHTSQSVSLRTNTGGDWDVEAIGTLYRFNKDQQRFPTSAAANDTTYGPAGRVAVLDGTGWVTADVKASWHPGGAGARNILSFGAHADYYKLFNPTYMTAEWTAGAYGNTFTEGDGKTRTSALWVQDAFNITPELRLTVGGRLEHFHAFDGFNQNGTTQVTQPELTATRFSPKAVLGWTSPSGWAVTGSFGQAYRFATPAELYQLVSTGATFTAPSPTLKPDNDLSGELRIERRWTNGSRAQVSFFEDDVHDAIISQFLPLVPGSQTLYSYISNVDHVRSRGIEGVVEWNDVLIRGLQFTGSMTYIDAKTLALSGAASATAAPGAAVGKRLPNIPDWRFTLVATYRPDTHWSFTAATRYSGKVYTTLDNADVNPNTYQGFSSWLVSDARVAYRASHHWNASLGMDNVFNRKYFFFHPFPQRTLVAGLRYSI